MLAYPVFHTMTSMSKMPPFSLTAPPSYRPNPPRTECITPYARRGVYRHTKAQSSFTPNRKMRYRTRIATPPYLPPGPVSKRIVSFCSESYIAAHRGSRNEPFCNDIRSLREPQCPNFSNSEQKLLTPIPIFHNLQNREYILVHRR
jgi:hypothetical protein